MDLAESAAYLRHHLALAGREEPLFADDAIARLHRVASSQPRALNNAATAALMSAASSKDLPERAHRACPPRRPAPPGHPQLAVEVVPGSESSRDRRELIAQRGGPAPSQPDRVGQSMTN